MAKVTLTHVILLAFTAYVINCLYVIYVLFNPPACKGTSRVCLRPKHKNADLNKLQVSVYTSPVKNPSASELKLAWENASISLLEYFKIAINVSVPKKTRRNGTLFAHVFVHPKNESPLYSSGKAVHSLYQLTKYAVPKDQAFNLITDNQQKKNATAIPHMYSKLVINVMTDEVSFERMSIPSDIFHLMQFTSDGYYLPIVHLDSLSTLDRYTKPINTTTLKAPLTVEITPVSLGRMRMWVSVEQSLTKMKELGFSDKDLDDVKGIFTDTNLYFLALTFIVSVFHMLFDFLAFKNDISFWKNRDSMEGLSLRTVFWRCGSTAIIFIYLLDEDTSLLVLVPAGIGAIIEFWKVSRALKVQVSWKGGWLPDFKLGERSKSEKETEEYDSQAMKYLSYLLYPLLIGGAIYTLVYYPHKSWYSWLVRCLVNGVYAFGFLFMLPQLFVNYKLKSVAHLPWRAFMYKAFNTFIDDVFAFIITMPTAHRLACFRDDVVFVVYLYQRWLYPVDKSRVNEYGISYEHEDDKQKKTQ